ncbi:MAG: LysR family transcriptional regulator [Elsteraceae bacterium]
MTDPDLADLDAFVAVARQRSFRGAANLRGVSASSLSEALRRLEARLGVRLLNRTTRSVTLTEVGERLLNRLSPALSDIAGALDAVNSFRDSPIGALRLNVPTVVARLILPPLVGPFLERHPGVTLEIANEDRFIDVLAAGFDAGVRYGESLERDMIAIPIGPRRQRFVTAAAPAYLTRHGRPVHPEDLLKHRCVRHRFDSGALADWEFERNGETVKIKPDGPLIATTIDLELAAALQGLGVIHSFDGFLADALRSGALEPVLEDWSTAFPGPFLYYHSRRHMPGPLRAFLDFLKEERGRPSRP